jgi:Immunity protein 50
MGPHVNVRPENDTRHGQVPWYEAPLSLQTGRNNMTWLDFAENPDAIRSTFDTTPSLVDVEVMRVIIEREGPTVEINTTLNEPPTRLSKRLDRSGANAVTVKLQFLGVQSLSLHGWASENRANVEIRPGISAKIGVNVTGTTMRLSCECAALRVAGLTAYQREISLGGAAPQQ